MKNEETVVLLQHIYAQLRNVYCVPTEVVYMKELQQLIQKLLDNTHSS